MTLIFIIMSKVTAQGSRYQEVCPWTYFFFFGGGGGGGGGCDFPTDFPSFSLSSYFPFYCAFISYFCFGLECSLRQAGLLNKRAKRP